MKMSDINTIVNYNGLKELEVEFHQTFDESIFSGDNKGWVHSKPAKNTRRSGKGWKQRSKEEAASYNPAWSACGK